VLYDVEVIQPWLDGDAAEVSRKQILGNGIAFLLERMDLVVERYKGFYFVLSD
jgi:hypothetical protein